MDDNRLTGSCVIRGGYTSRNAHGNETVQTGLQETGDAQAQGHAVARAGRSAGRGGSAAGCEPADRIELGCEALGGSAGVAAQGAGASEPLGDCAACFTWEDDRRWSGGQRLPDRVVDAAAGGDADQEGIRPVVQHGACLEAAQAVGLLQPAPDGARGAARRTSYPALEGPALAVAQKKARENGAPSSS